jgi:NhaP-type Na+/H+ or K+/H+ antiporter
MDGLGGAAVAAAVAVGYCLVARRLGRLNITAPMVFVAVGAAFGESGLRLVPGPAQAEHLLGLAELTLAVLLFADASTVSLGRVRDDAVLPARLLFVGLPLTIAAGTVLAELIFPAAGWWEAALIAAMLAPTDAALGLPVVDNPAVPRRIRRLIIVESGLNDGIATPFVLLLLAVVAMESTQVGSVAGALRQMAVAVLVAVVVGWSGGRLLPAARDRGWTSGAFAQFGILALALLAYAGSVALDGNGFVAAFGAGIWFGSASRRAVSDATEFTENVAIFASFAVWLLFGVALVGPALAAGDLLEPVLFAVLALTVVRMVPVGLALAGAGLRLRSWLFVGWFGPRGLATVVFILITVSSLADLPPAAPIVQAATVAVVLSVFLHGLTAAPLSARYGRWIRGQDGARELIDVPPHRPHRQVRLHLPGPPRSGERPS